MSPRSRTATLPEDVGMYLDTLRQRFPAIESVWLLGVDADRSHDTPWRLLAFGDAKLLAGMRGTPDVQRDDVELSVVTDGDLLESVRGDKPPASLAAMRWRLDAPDAASYREVGAKGKRAKAQRVR